MTRLLDIILSAIGLIILSPLLLVVYLLVACGSKGGGFYSQERIGKDGRPFNLYKFRTMYVGADRKQLITVGEHDARITNIGYFLRKYKIDELPQLWNVLIGDMSIVGPRPEVKKYVDLYTEQQRAILRVKPGITDYASIEYTNENELLGKAENPDQTYITQIMPDKIRYNMKYINNPTLHEYFKIIFLTIKKIVR